MDISNGKNRAEVSVHESKCRSSNDCIDFTSAFDQTESSNLSPKCAKSVNLNEKIVKSPKLRDVFSTLSTPKCRDNSNTSTSFVAHINGDDDIDEIIPTEREEPINNHIFENYMNDDPPIISLKVEKTPVKCLPTLGIQPVVTNATDTSSTFDKNPDPEIARTILKNLKLKYVNKVLFGNLNICSLGQDGKFESLVYMIDSNLDIIVLTETHLDETLSTRQFPIDGFKPYRVDKMKKGGGVMIYVRVDIPSQ